MGNDPRKTWTSIVPRWRGDRWNRLTRQTIDESNGSWFVGPAGNRIVENAIRHPSHSLRAVPVFWSPLSSLTDELRRQWTLGRARSDDDFTACHEGGACLPLIPNWLARLFPQGRHCCARAVTERSLVVVFGSSSIPLRLPQASPCNKSTTEPLLRLFPHTPSALSEGPELSPGGRATAAVNSTTLGSGASPSSHPVHRICPPYLSAMSCDLTLGSLLFSLPVRPWTREKQAQQTATEGLGLPVASWVLGCLRDTCISDLQDAQSGLGHTPNVNVTLQMQIPDLSTVTIFFELRNAGSARAGTRVGLRILSSLSQLCAKLHRASAPSLRRWSETFTSAHARLILSRGTFSHNGYRGLSAEPRGQQTNKMEFAFSKQHGPAADRCNGSSTHSVTLFANVSTRSPRHAAETLPSLRLTRKITVLLYGQQIPLWRSGNEAVQNTKTFHLPD
ncbi:hypothetical protein CSIM01_09629 [Colletotrichum simmondsii]|uniref:Uncharacterized protein n=1 Tax=Colletotrichum simmondsii TaxID=703756 RepID=A0A135TSU4_9PEZI|nr:hypothetical protein CSIM01_09629 [Colletotrichum simmondsii]